MNMSEVKTLNVFEQNLKYLSSKDITISYSVDNNGMFHFINKSFVLIKSHAMNQ